MNRPTTKHQKRLQTLKKKKVVPVSRYSHHPPSSPVAGLGDSIYRYTAEIIFLIVLAVGLLAIWELNPLKKEIKQLQSFLKENPTLTSQYSNGYRVITIQKNKIKPVYVDTLSKDFKIDWGQTRLRRLSNDEVDILLSNIRYVPDNFSLGQLMVKVPRGRRGIFVLSQLGNIEFLGEILEDDGNKIWCLFSYEEKKK